MKRVSVRLQEQSFDPGAETNSFLANANAAGAVVTFTGLVRSTPEAPIEALTLEHYPELAQKQLQSIGEQALERFDLLALSVIHRFGRMTPEEPIVQVMAMASHRQAAFDGASFVMDWLKTDAPFWKKETRPDGEHWVSARSADDQAKLKWNE